MPGQFRYLAPHLAQRGHDVIFMTQRKDRELPGVRKLVYAPRRQPGEAGHRYLRGLEDAILHGQETLRACQALRQAGYVPDVIVGHPGWGETLFVKAVYDKVPVVAYGEFYFRPENLLSWFDPDEAHHPDDICRTRISNSHILMAMENADLGWSPTQWQAATFPDLFQPRIRTVFDGIDTAVVRPDPAARLTLPDGQVVTADDEIITYAARNLELMRGFPSFMRALPEILAARPKAQVVITGGDLVSYDSAITKQTLWREKMLAEIELPPGRVHFLGYIPYDQYLSLLQVSAAHIYLTYPFVLSWSFFEAMAAGCLMVASDTAPVRELVRHGDNGLMTDFWDHGRIAQDVLAALEDPRRQALRQAARATVVERYGMEACLAGQRGILAEATGRAW